MRREVPCEGGRDFVTLEEMLCAGFAPGAGLVVVGEECSSCCLTGRKWNEGWLDRGC